MQRRSQFILPLAVAGGLFLAASPFLFHYPPFGWAVWGLISLLFVIGMRGSWRELRRIEKELLSLQQAAAGDPWNDPSDGSEISNRIQQLQKLQQKGGGEPDFSEILSAKESSRGTPALSGAVVMLGLIGTFFGLMVVIASAGPAVEQQSGSYDVGMVLQPVFSGMRGIFGTSLCGLVAALILNLARSLHQELQLRFMAEIEEFTRFRLLPSFATETAAASDPVVGAIEQLMSRLEQTREKWAASMRLQQEQSAAQNATVVEAIESTVGSLRSLFAEQLAEQMESSSRLLLALEAAQKTELAQCERLERGFSSLPEKMVQQFEGVISSGREAQTAQLLEALQNQSGVQELAGALATQSRGVIEALKEQAAENQRTRGELYQKLSADRATAAEERQNKRASLLRELSSAVESGLEKQSDRLEELLRQSREELGKALAEDRVRSADMGEESRDGQLQEELLLKVMEQIEGGAAASSVLAESVALIRANQIEFQSGLEMFQQGVAELLDGLQRSREVEGAQNSYFERLEAALAAFSERAAETIAETSLHTQEILLEVLKRSGNANSTAAEE